MTSRPLLKEVVRFKHSPPLEQLTICIRLREAEKRWSGRPRDGWQVFEVAAGHAVMMSQPELLADLLDQIAGQQAHCPCHPEPDS